MLSLKHSLHRKASDAKGFYAVYCGLIAVSAGLVLTPGAPLGLLTNAVQTLAGVLLPSATVFLLLLCNDKEVLGPWVNTRWLNMFTGAVIAALVILSIILTASVMFPDATSETVILDILGGGVALAALVALAGFYFKDKSGEAAQPIAIIDPDLRAEWRMPPLETLAPASLSLSARTWMFILRFYLVLAGGSGAGFSHRDPRHRPWVISSRRQIRFGAVRRLRPLVASRNHRLDQTDDQAEHETSRPGDENPQERPLIGLGQKDDRTDKSDQEADPSEDAAPAEHRSQDGPTFATAEQARNPAAQLLFLRWRR